MGNTLAEVDQVVQAIESIAPLIFGGLQLAGVPVGAATVALPIFAALANGVHTVAQDTGKPLDQVIQDVISHLSAGQPNAPALAPTAAARAHAG